MSLADQVKKIVKDKSDTKKPSAKLHEQQAYYERLVRVGIAQRDVYNILPIHEAEKEKLVCKNSA